MSKFNYNSITVDIIEKTAIISINRPEKLNSMNKEVKLELIDILNKFELDDSIKVIIITGSGNKAFIVGDDISEFKNRKKDDFKLLQDLTSKIENYKKPVIAAINGYALGGGYELALACDFRISSKNSKFGFPEINLGLIPGAGGTQRLPRLIGKSKAKQLILTGKLIDSNLALQIGLIDEITEPSELMDKCIELAEILTKKSSLALEFGKKAINYSTDFNIQENMEKELDMVWKLKNTEESKKLVNEFLKKNK
ncbi:MAG: enoyl-CoA hydratase/isomerase family protein [Candidatus Helarchaeota archaeon]